MLFVYYVDLRTTSKLGVQIRKRGTNWYELRIVNSPKLKRTLTEIVVVDDFSENFASVKRRLFATFPNITPFALLEAKFS